MLWAFIGPLIFGFFLKCVDLHVPTYFCEFLYAKGMLTAKTCECKNLYIYIFDAATVRSTWWRTETANQRGREWMGGDKNYSRRRWRLQQDEHGFQHTSPTHYPSWPSPRSHWSATRPGNQETTFRAKTHQHAQRKLARLAACAAPVRTMAYAGQTGGQSRSGRWLQQPHNKGSREPQWLL
jgi:hypothetical protein